MMKIRKLPLIIAVHTAVAGFSCSVFAQEPIQVENNPPKIKTSSLPNAQEDQSYSFQVEAIDKDENGRALNFRLKKGPKGLRLSSKGKISFQPGFKDAGKYELLISVSDGEFSTEKTLKLTVENTNRLPEIITENIPQAAENKRFLQEIVAKDADGEKLEYKLKKAPKGLAITGNKITWTPTFEQAGNYSIEVWVNDPFDSVMKSYGIDVTNTNRAPSYAGKPSYAGEENDAIEIPLRAKDADKDTLAFTLVSGPEGLNISEQGMINWLPSYEQAGDYDVDFAISDGDLSVDHSIKLAVKPVNRPPSVTTETLAGAKEDQPYSAVILGEDPDKEDARSLSFSLRGAPKGMVISPAGEIEWVPSFDMAGEQSFTVVITDGKTSSKKPLTIEVENTNRVPAFSSEPISLAKEASTYSYKVKPSDPDGGELTVSLLEGPEGMTLVGNKLSFTPSYTQAGEYAVQLQVSDGDLVAEQLFTLEVENTNRLPVIKAVAETATALFENKAWQLAIQYEDADNETIDLTLVTYPQGLSLEGNQLSWTPGFEQAGKHKVVIEASDSIDVSSYSFELLVTNVNRLPQFTGTMPSAAKENTAFTYALTGSDPDRQALTFALLNGPEGMALQGAELSWTPTFDQAGEHEVQVSVFDSEDTVETRFVLNVENTNRAPVFPEAVTSVKEDQVYQYDIKATDPDGEKVTLTVLQKPEDMDFNGKRLKFKPNFFQSGKYPIEIVATDGDLQTTQTFELVVENVNRKPVVTSKPGKIAHETLEYTYQVTATDADKEELKISLQQAPDGMKIKKGLISWTPLYTQGGAQPVVVAVYDGIDTTTHEYSINVDNANRTPTLDKVPDQKVVKGEKLVYQAVYSDPDGDKVSFTLSHAPKGMKVNKKGKVIWKTTDADLGRHSVILQASDGDLKRRRMFDVEVVEPVQ